MIRRPIVAVCLTVAVVVTVLRSELPDSHPVAAHASAVPSVTPSAAPRTTVAGPTTAEPRHPAVHHAHSGVRSPATVAAHRPATSSAPAAPHATTPVRPRAHPTARPTRPSPSPSPTAPSGTFTGSPFSTPYGNVQVQIKVTDGRIMDVVALQLPSDNQRSQELSSQAGPQLRQEALDAQSANIDTVSGATYTSDGYRQSLQAAIDAERGGS